MKAPLLRRGGLTINPFVFLLLLLLAGLIVWRMVVYNDLLAEARPDIPANVRLQGVIFGLVLSTVVVLTVAGGIGAGTYFATGRSDGAANGAISLVLLLGCGWFGYLIYNTMTAPRPTAPNGAQASAAKPRETLAEETRRLNDENMERMRQQSAAIINHRPDPPSATGSPTPSIPALRAPAGTAGSPSASQPAPPVSNPEEGRKAKAALDPVRDEVNAKIKAFIDEATPLIESLAKPPKALRSDLDGRVSSTAALKGKSDELEGYLRSIDGRAESALKAAGLDLGAQIRQKAAFSQSVDAFAKANACGTYKRVFDAGLEETQALRDSAGKWRTDGAGQITSGDRALQGRLKQLHESLQFHLRSIPEAQNALKK